MVVTVTFPRWFVDDGYMLFRYSSNLAHSGAPVFNLQGPPVEGTTGIALTGLLALASLAHVPLEAADHAVGVVATFLAAFVLGAALRALRAASVTSAIAVALFLTTPPLFVHAFSGLETSLFLALVNTSFLLLVWLLKNDATWGRNACLLSAALLATSLCRPEGVALTAVFIATALTYFWRRHPAYVRGVLLRFSAIYVAPAVLYFVWRASYYGRLLPNTYYVKTSVGLSSAVIRNLAQFAVVYLITALPLLAALLVAGRAWSRREHNWQRQPVQWTYQTAAMCGAVLATGAIMVSYLHSSLDNDYSFRFVVPYYGLVLIVLAYGTEQLCRSLVIQGGHRVRRWLTATIAVAFAAQLGINVLHLQGERQYAQGYIRLLQGEDIAVGRRLQATLPPNAVVASYQAGAVSWFSKLEVIDIIGLNDRTLANQQLTAKQVTDYVFSKHPQAIVLEADRKRSNWILADPRMSSFKLVGQYHTGYLTELLYVRS